MQTTGLAQPDFLIRFGPLIGVAVGWFLHEISDIIRRRREDRRVAGQVLAELLEIRHSMLAIPIVVGELRKRLPIPDEAESMLRTVLAPVIGNMTAGLSERYNRAIDSAAGAFPVLAFELRSKERLGGAFDLLRPIVAGDPHAAALLSEAEGTVTEKALPMLNELTLRLAKLHGLRTWLEVRQRLNRPEPPPEVREILNSLVKRLNLESFPKP